MRQGGDAWEVTDFLRSAVRRAWRQIGIWQYRDSVDCPRHDGAYDQGRVDLHVALVSDVNMRKIRY